MERIMSDGKRTQRIVLRVDEQLQAQIKDEAERNEVSVSAYIRWLVQQDIGPKPKPHPLDMANELIRACNVDDEDEEIRDAILDRLEEIRKEQGNDNYLREDPSS